MSKQASVIFLDVLEHLPAKTAVIFTTNNPENFESRLKQRCECHNFKTPVKDFGNGDGAAETAAQKLIDDVWQKELGHNTSPKLADLEGWKDGGNLSFRSVLQALEPLIRLQREDDAAAIPPPLPEIAPIQTAPQMNVPMMPSGRVSALAEMEMAAKFFARA